MKKGCNKDLRRVRQYDTFLSKTDCRWSVYPDEVDDTSVEVTDRSNTPTHHLDHSIGSCSEGNTSSWSLGISSACSGADGTIIENLPTIGCIGGSGLEPADQQQYIIEGRHGPVVKYRSPNNHGAIRNNRFQRFVAAKQHRRERALKSARTTSTDCEQGDSMSVSDVSVPEIQQKENGELDSNPCTSIESPTSDAESNLLDKEKRQLQNTVAGSNDSPTSVAEMQDAHFFPDSSRNVPSPLPPRLDNQSKNTQKYLFVRVESKLNRKGAMKQPGSTQSYKETNKLTWWDDQVNRHKRSNLKSDASCDALDDSFCIDGIQKLSLGRSKLNACRDTLPSETTIADDLLPYCTTIQELWDNTIGALFGSKSDNKVSPPHSKVEASDRDDLHLECFSPNIDDDTLDPSSDKGKALPNAKDESSICDSEATPPTSNTSWCSSVFD